MVYLSHSLPPRLMPMSQSEELHAGPKELIPCCGHAINVVLHNQQKLEVTGWCELRQSATDMVPDRAHSFLRGMRSRPQLSEACAL